MPSEKELNDMVTKAILVCSAKPTVTEIIKNLQSELTKWFKKNGFDPTDKLIKKLQASEIF